jgi:hypothetical protein
MIPIKYLLENKVVIRIANIYQLDLLYMKYPFTAAQKRLMRDSFERNSKKSYCIEYYRSEFIDGEYTTEYNQDNGFFEKQGYKVISFNEVMCTRIKITFKLPKYDEEVLRGK